MRILLSINKYKVRNLCIEQGYYTRGNNEQYDHLLFNLCDTKEATFRDVKEIALNIFEHSNKDKLASKYDCSWNDVVNTIYEFILNECCYMNVIEYGNLELK